MHPWLIAAAVLALLLWWLTRRSDGPEFGSPVAAGAASPAPGESHPSARRLAFVARGKLFYAGAGESLREVHSPHVQAIADRMERSRELHGWKQDTTFSVRANRLQRGQGDDFQIHATSAQLTGDGRMIYFLRDQSMGGLFEQELATGAEKRLLYRQNLLLDDLRLHPDGLRLLGSQHSSNGSANIVTLGLDGEGYRELTGGDTVDTAPCWLPQSGQVVFQSSGIARNAHGMVLAQGPASIQLLDMAQAKLTPVLDDPRFDHLQPRVAPDGSLLYIRRPFDAPRRRGGDALVDVLMFPFRVLRALFHYLNFFSLMYAQKPLTSAEGPEVQADLKQMLLKGQRIDTEAALRKGQAVNGVPSLVPANWVLVRRQQSGTETVLATHVASFDLSPDGSLLYSNGYGVFTLDANGKSSVVLRDKLIAEIVAG